VEGSVVRFGSQDLLFGDPLDDMVVEGEPLSIEFGVVDVVPFMYICADMGDDGEEVVGAIPIIGFVGDGVGCVWGHVEGYGKTDVFVYFCLSTIEALPMLDRGYELEGLVP
jgi:hypothetical protein